ncbi:MAG: response regulator [Lachnospiraceae bacterium]|nr:response regulator [Lachnospiraceae bacterium]
MEDRIRTDLIVIIVTTIVGIFLITESIVFGWEYWVPYLFSIGIIVMWIMLITGYKDNIFRENICLSYAAVGLFFHGVNQTADFDISVLTCVFLVVFSILGRRILINFLLLIYLLVAGINIGFLITEPLYKITFEDIFEVAFHVLGVVIVYNICRIWLREKLSYKDIISKNNQKALKTEKDTEDFLTNISHELRTPVNVVNGMSKLILDKEYSREIMIIKDAGKRLSRQVDDILDYTEIGRGELILDDDNYMVTSLINDVLVDVQAQKEDVPEIIVDVDPEIPMYLKGDYSKLKKIFRHLIDNSIKFTRRGGIYVGLSFAKREYGINLLIKIKDTGIGMSEEQIQKSTAGLYQANKERNRSSGGIGLGLYIVGGFVHKMDGVVKIESEIGKGTSVLLSIPQKVVDPEPCLGLDPNINGNIVIYLKASKFDVPEVRDFHDKLISNVGKVVNLGTYFVSTFNELKKITEKIDISYLFVEEEEYLEMPQYYEDMARKNVVVAVSAGKDIEVYTDSRVVFVPKPLYAYTIIRVINSGNEAFGLFDDRAKGRMCMRNVRALIVDDEPMNLVVATGLFKEYGMETDTAESGRAAIEKYRENDYDMVFMDHMMPEMDGVEAMKKLKEFARDTGRTLRIIALTANAVSGAREMFIEEGFDGFVAKPIDISEFERTMRRVLPESLITYEKTVSDSKVEERKGVLYV